MYNKNATGNRDYKKGFTGNKFDNKGGFKKDFKKDFKKPFNKDGKSFGKGGNKSFKKPNNFIDFKKIAEVLGDDVITKLRITNGRLLNGKNLELTDYVNPRTGKYIKAGDKVFKCRWQLKQIGIRTSNPSEPVVYYPLKGTCATFRHNGVEYVVQTLFREDENGKVGMRVCVNGFETYALLREFECIDLVPSPAKDPKEELKCITLRENWKTKTEEEVLSKRKLELRVTDDQMDKLEHLRRLYGMETVADVLRKIIAER